MTDRKEFVSNRKAFAWQPQWDTWVALLSILFFTGIYYINTNYGQSNIWISLFLFIFVGHFFLNTFVPAWVVLYKRQEGLAGLGIRKQKAIVSIGLSVLISAGSFYPLLQSASDLGISTLIPHVLFNALVFWEVLFVFGWLHLRFEKAFGFVFAPLLTAIGFCFYHLGSFPVAELPILYYNRVDFCNNICIYEKSFGSLSTDMGCIF